MEDLLCELYLRLVMPALLKTLCASLISDYCASSRVKTAAASLIEDLLCELRVRAAVLRLIKDFEPC